MNILSFTRHPFSIVAEGFEKTMEFPQSLFTFVFQFLPYHFFSSTTHLQAGHYTRLLLSGYD
jgi:hypothetical protein